jgi:hypothetical protein
MTKISVAARSPFGEWFASRKPEPQRHVLLSLPLLPIPRSPTERRSTRTGKPLSSLSCNVMSLEEAATEPKMQAEGVQKLAMRECLTAAGGEAFVVHTLSDRLPAILELTLLKNQHRVQNDPDFDHCALTALSQVRTCVSE